MNNAPAWPRKEILKVTLPSLLTVLFFVVAIFVVALPIFKRNLLEEKKQTLTAVTAVANGILTYYQGLAEAGEISLATAQARAIAQIRQFRYGQNGKDYFWINNQTPRMIMHPYRSDLEGVDLSTYTDSSGLHLFQKMEEQAEKRTAELQAAMAEVKVLNGFLPICAACKNIRDDKGYWNQIESYIRDHSEVEFTHSICPDCTKKLYPNLKLPVLGKDQD